MSKPKFTFKNNPESGSGDIHKVEVFVTKGKNIVIHRHILSAIPWPGEIQRKYFDKYLTKQEIMFTGEEFEVINNNLKKFL